MLKVSDLTVTRDLSDWGMPGQLLVFNTETGRSFTVADRDWARIVEGAKAYGESSPELRTTIRKLAVSRYLVSQNEDEIARAVQNFEDKRRHPPRIFPLLTVTTACNIACTYCYEEGIKSQHMNDEVVDAVVAWLERRVVEDGITEINPGLFGGEPLMRPKTLLRLMDRFNAMMESHGASGYFYCSTNGVLLTDELAARLSARGLKQIQISLDGPAHIHDLRRKGHKDQPSFEESLRALHIAVEHFESVTLKVNFDRQNVGYFAQLFDEVIAAGLRDRVDVKLEAIAAQLEGSSVAHDPDYPIPPESPEMANAYTGGWKIARDKGFRVDGSTAHTTPCMFTSEHGVIIGSDGSLYKCISMVGRPEVAVGTVFREQYDPAYERQMNATKRISECVEERCSYLPVCAGGCAYESVVRTGSYEPRYCTKDALAEFHFKKHLVRHEKALVRRGMRPLDATDDFPVRLRDSLPAPSVGGACGGCPGSGGPASGGATFIPLDLGSLRRK